MAKASRETARQNYEQMCALFRQAIPDSERFQIVYGMGLDIRTGVIKDTYTYISYAIGYDPAAADFLILPINPDLSGCGEPISIEKQEIKKAKRAMMSGEITVQAKKLPQGYINFSVPEEILKDSDDIALLVSQSEEAKRFVAFIKTSF